MKHLLTSAALAFAMHAAAQPQGTADVRQLAWLQGCWLIDTPERIVEEQWSAPRAHTMLGSSRTLRSDKLVAHEFVLLREQGDQLAYEVRPSGQAPTVFLSIKLANNGVVFENLQHDFPQRVGYERKGNELFAWIEGQRNGQLRRIAYPYTRVACAGD